MRFAAIVAAVVVLMAPDLRAEFKRELRLQLAEQCAAEGDVLGWGKALMPDKFPLGFCELHHYLVSVRKEKFVSVEAPRGHAKTTVGCFLVPLYQALNEPKEYRHYLNLQSNVEKGLAINRAIKLEIEGNELIRALYGNQIGRDRWTDAVFALKNGVVFSADGAGASIRGINYRSMRPDYCICDDLYDTDADAPSPTNTEKKNSWFFSALYPALAQDRRTSMRLQGTAVNRVDLFEKLRADPTVASRTFRAVVDWDKKEVLWKGLKTFEEFEQMRVRMGTLIFSREFQNERRDDSSSIIKQAWLYPDDGSQNWEYDPTKLRFDAGMTYAGAVVALDPSIGAKNTSDYSAYARVLMGQPSDGSLVRFYIEEIVQGHHSFQQRVDTVKELLSHRPIDRPVTKVRVESVSGFRDIGERIAASVSVPCELVDHVPNKLTNLERASALFENRRVFLNQNINPALKTELANQLCQNAPRHDDLRDAVLLAITTDTAAWSSWV